MSSPPVRPPEPNGDAYSLSPPRNKSNKSRYQTNRHSSNQPTNPVVNQAVKPSTNQSNNPWLQGKSSFPFYGATNTSANQNAVFSKPVEASLNAEVVSQPKINQSANQSNASTSSTPVQQPANQSTNQADKPVNPMAVQVSPRQRGNTLLSFIRLVPWEYISQPINQTTPDYLMGETTCALFLSLKYALLHPQYLHSRMQPIRGHYSCRVLIALVDTDDNDHLIVEISKSCVINQWTFLLVWSFEEAARYIELFKVFEKKGRDRDAIDKLGMDETVDARARLTEVLSVIRGINKTNVATLMTRFGSIAGLARAKPEQVEALPGLGQAKISRLFKAFSQPFITSTQITQLAANDPLPSPPVNRSVNQSTNQSKPSSSLFQSSKRSLTEAVSTDIKNDSKSDGTKADATTVEKAEPDSDIILLD